MKNFYVTEKIVHMRWMCFLFPNPYISRMVAKAHDVVDMMIQRDVKLNVVTYTIDGWTLCDLKWMRQLKYMVMGNATVCSVSFSLEICTV